MKEQYSRVTHTELEEVCIFHEQYTGKQRTKYIWEWQYGKFNPNVSVLIGVKVNSKYIATQGMYTIKLHVGEEIELTGKNESLLIDREYRGTGLSSKLYDYSVSEYRKENITCLWGFSRKAIGPLKRAQFIIYTDVIKRAYLSLNYKHAYKLSTRKESSKFKKASTAFKVLLGTTYSKIFFNNFIRTKSRSNSIFLNYMKSPDDLEILFYKLRKQNPDLIHIHQNSAFYKWRILDSPLKVDQFFLYDEDDLIGYMYLIFRSDFCEITDLTFLNEETGKIIVDKLKVLLLANSANFVFYTYNSKNNLNRKVLSQLKKIGFVTSKAPNHFVLRNFKHDISESFFDIKRWYINNLWSEGI